MNGLNQFEQNVYQEAHVNFWKKVYLAAIYYCKRLAVRTRTFFFFFFRKISCAHGLQSEQEKVGVNNAKSLTNLM